MNDCNFDILKENIRKRMSDKHMTQKDVAKALNTTQANIAKHLKKGDDAQIFTLKQVCLLADLFETSVDELLGKKIKRQNYSVEQICLFLAELISQEILKPVDVNVKETIWEENDVMYDEEPGFTQITNVTSKYKAFYFPNFLQIPAYYQSHVAYNLLDEFKACGNSLTKGIEINKFLNKFISSFNKHNEGILDDEDYNSIIQTHFNSLKKLKI
jgi:predicted transcriptional regulator